MARSDVAGLRTALVRLNALTLALVFGALAGAGIFLATLFLVIKGGPNMGATLGLLVHYLPGYTVSLGGAFLGLMWGVVLGAALAFGPAWIFYRGVLGAVDRFGYEDREEALLRSEARVHISSFAGAFGLFCAQAVFLATVWLVLKHEPGEPLGPHLDLLHHYMPGYSVSVLGAVLGAVYAFVQGFVAFLIVGWIYNRLVGAGTMESRHLGEASVGQARKRRG